jgi:hypothetical protein
MRDFSLDSKCDIVTPALPGNEPSGQCKRSAVEGWRRSNLEHCLHKQLLMTLRGFAPPGKLRPAELAMTMQGGFEKTQILRVLIGRRFVVCFMDGLSRS